MKNLKKNIIINVIYQVSLILFPLITTPYVSRVLGVTNVGTFSYTHSVAHYFLLFGMLGMSNLGNREIASVRENQEKLNKTFTSLFFIQTITSIISITAFIIFTIFNKGDLTLFYWIQLFYVFTSLLDISWLYFGLEDFIKPFIRGILVKIISTTLIFIFVRNENSIVLYSLIMTFSIFIGQILLWIGILKKVQFTRIDAQELKNIFINDMILFIPIVAVSVYKIMDKVMLGEISTLYEVGLYESAEKIYQVALTIIVALANSVMPRMNYLYNTGQTKEATKIIEKSMYLTAFIAPACAFGVLSISKMFVPLYFGNDYVDAIPILNILSLTIIAVSWANLIRTQYMIPNKLDKIYIISVIAGAIVNVLLNFIIIPKYGSFGAAISTLITEFIVAFIQTTFVYKKLSINKFFIDIVSFSVIGVLMFIALRSITFHEGLIINLLISIFFGAVLYIIAAIIYTYLFRRNIYYLVKNYIKKVLNKKGV